MTYSIVHQDNFNRSDRNLNGDTMSDGLGQWTTQTNLLINTNEAGSNSGWLTGYDNTQSDIADVKVSIKRTGELGMAVCRIDSSDLTNGGLYAMEGRNGACYLWRRDSGTFVQLATGGGTSSGDKITVEAVGSTITGYVNDVQILQVTDSTYSTGKVGMTLHGAFAVTTADDWMYEVDVAGGSTHVQAFIA